MKHFEQLWEESEARASLCLDLVDAIFKLSKIATNWENLQVPDSQDMGEVLFALTKLSHHYNINVFQALQDKLQDVQAEQLDGGEGDLASKHAHKSQNAAESMANFTLLSPTQIYEIAMRHSKHAIEEANKDLGYETNPSITKY